jgi:hypothetical protein
MSLSYNRLSRISVLILAVTLILSLALTTAPVTANGPTTTPSLEINPHPTISATVSTQFTIQIWIRNIPAGYKLDSFDISVYWDPTQMELLDHKEFTPPGKNWIIQFNIGPDHYGLKNGATSTQDTTDLEMAWASLTFHCLAEGTSIIDLSSAVNAVILSDGQTLYPTYPDPFTITCNQVQPRPVGGVVVPVSRLQILAPYLALVGLVIAVSAVVVVKRRIKD